MEILPDVTDRATRSIYGPPPDTARRPLRADRDGSGPLGRPAGIAWQRKYARLVATADLTVIATSVAVFILMGLGGGLAADRARLVSGLVAAGLMVAALPLCRAWDGWALGHGSIEFVRLGRATAATVDRKSVV